MTIPLYERDGLDFRPQDGKTSERQFAIIAFVIVDARAQHPVYIQTTTWFENNQS